MVDVTVRGAGVFGLSIAWACVQKGASVQVIDPNGPGAGSSGGIVGALAPHVPENWNPKKAFQLESLLMAQGFWEQVATAGQQDPGYIRSGRLQPIADEAALNLARRRADTAQTLWQTHAQWRVIELPTSAWTVASPTGLAVKDTLSALIHPRKSVAALVAALRAKNVSINSESPDKGHVLWANGVAGLEMLNQDHHRQVGNGVKGQAALLDYDAVGAPQLFADSIHIIPHGDGTVAIGSTSERTYTTPDKTDDQLDEVIAKARLAVPALANAPVIDRWAGVRPRARSRAPMLGLWADRPGHFIANGGFKIGFGMAPKIAHVMADLMLDGHDTIPQGFDVSASL
ncbi:MAG: NAD(P)/FAD-dependent oxidoreductase [Roseobacter sp.]